jgi:hypothetical protein
MRLTKPQLAELRLLSKGPQCTYGSPRTRVQNNLCNMGLARYVVSINRTQDLCEITPDGVKVLHEIPQANHRRS